MESRAGAGGAGARAPLFKGAQAEWGEAAQRPQAQAGANSRDAGAATGCSSGSNMRRSVCLALVASLMHGKASGSPRPPLLTRDPGHILGGFGRPAQGPGSGARARQGDRAVMPGEGEPRASVLRRLGGGGPWQGAWGAPPPAFPEQPARLSSPEVSLQGEFQRKLYKDLVKNYNPLERPVANDSQPLTVYFSLSLLQIMDVVSTGPAPSPRLGFRGAVEAPGGMGWSGRSRWPGARRARAVNLALASPLPVASVSQSPRRNPVSRATCSPVLQTRLSRCLQTLGTSIPVLSRELNKNRSEWSYILWYKCWHAV